MLINNTKNQLNLLLCYLSFPLILKFKGLSVDNKETGVKLVLYYLHSTPLSLKEYELTGNKQK